MLSINNNIIASNITSNLITHNKALATSTRRLSSGLRIGSAADGSTDLAVREMMRSDIAALHQGIRNANDAVSLIQTADGSLQIIDEKLIRMKELAEQAATGTYSSTQRLIINSEYQSMASEITRIANSSEFNGIHLLNGNLEPGFHDGSGLTSTGKMKIHFGTGNSATEDYYYIQIESSTSESLSLGSGSTFATSMQKLRTKIRNNFEERLKPMVKNGTLSQQDYDDIMANSGAIVNRISEMGMPPDETTFSNNYDFSFNNLVTNDPPMLDYPREGYTLPTLAGTTTAEKYASYQALSSDDREKLQYVMGRDSVQWHLDNYSNYDWETFADNWDTYAATFAANPGVKDAVGAATIDGLKWYTNGQTYAGNNIQTQENAQFSLEAITSAIEVKDSIRAKLGATQNRLENTISNLGIQVENMQVAESRISDVDVSVEMTSFVRNQILAQSAVAMLAQANSMPKMALQIIGG